jgi:cytochrome c551/c552
VLKLVLFPSEAAVAKKLVIVGFLIVVVAAFLILRRPEMRGNFQPPRYPEKLNKKTVAEVGLAYKKDVEPLLKQACFDCHSTNTVFPWYHALPGVQQYLDSHVEHGRHDLDLSNGFPFNTDVPVMRHLRRIARVVKSGDMPLWDYRLMHPNARLSDDQKKIIVDWAESSFEKLSETAKD